MHRTARGTHRLVYLGIAVLAFVLSFIDSNLPLSVQLGFLVGGVALLGLPHGALDPLLARASGVARTGAQLARFMVLYVTAAALVVGLWWLAPVMTLAGFLLLSIWHFRSDWNSDISGSQAIAAAASVICTPALFHPAAVSEIFSALVFGESVQQLVWITRLLGAMALIGVAVTIIRITIAKPSVALELISLPLLAWALPPLLFFVVYFCGLHSPRHIIESLNMIRIRKHVVVYTAASITAVTIAVAVWSYGLFAEAGPTQALITIVFVGLAALTVPHMLLIERVIVRRKEPVST